jgi:Kef-type K+ transport system membrane component KefB
VLTENILILLGALLLASLALESLGRRTRLPRVTLLILFGFLIGPGGIGLIPVAVEQWYPLITDMALGMIGFLLGGKLTLHRLRRMGALVAWVSLLQVAVTYLVVAMGLSLIGVPLALSLLLAAIATATDPAATSDVIDEGHAEGKFTELLQGVVAIDDAWGLIVFSLTLVLVQIILGNGAGMSLLQLGLWELAGALLLGLVLGIPVAILASRLHDNRPVLVEALGAVLLCVGLAHWLEVSYLLACVALGCTIANVARHHQRSFHAIEDIEWPFVIVFFVLSGAMLSWKDLLEAEYICLGYILLRIVGRLLGGRLAALPAWTRTMPLQWMGLAMLPQAGVAMAMAIVAVQAVPEFSVVLPVVIASTVLFELLGPVCTRIALIRVGELAKER